MNNYRMNHNEPIKSLQYLSTIKCKYYEDYIQRSKYFEECVNIWYKSTNKTANDLSIIIMYYSIMIPSKLIITNLINQIAYYYRLFDSFSITNILWSLNILNIKPNDYIINCLLVSIKNNIDNFTFDNIMITITILLKFKITIDKCIVDALQKHFTSNYNIVNSNKLMNILRIFVNLNITIDDNIYFLIMSIIKKEYQEFNHNHISNILLDLTKLHIDITKYNITNCLIWSITKNINKLNNNNIKNIIYALEKLKINNADDIIEYLKIK